MKPAELAKPLGVFAVIIVVVLAGTAVLSLAGGGGSGAPDGQNIDGQSPPQFQPDEVNVDVDPENGNITVDADQGRKRVLIDTGHDNSFDRDELEPAVEALTAAGHEVDIGAGSGGSGFGSSDYNATLQEYDAVLTIFPRSGFSESERTALHKYTDGGGRLVVLGEPTQTAVEGGGLFASPTSVTVGATDLINSYGIALGSESLYSLDDETNENNFRSVYAEPVADDELTDGVERVTFHQSGYAVRQDGSDAQTLFTAIEGTRGVETRRTGTYRTVLRNDSMVYVADSDFITRSELYDADNEVFVSNLLDFLVSGNKPDDVPSVPEDGGGGFGGGGGGGGSDSGGNDEGTQTPAGDS